MSEKRSLMYGDRKSGSASARKSHLPQASNRPSSLSQPSSLPRPSRVVRPSTIGSKPSNIRPSSVGRSLSATSKRQTQELRHTFGRPSSSGLRRYGSDSYLNTPSRYTLSTPRGRSPGVRQSTAPPDSSRKAKHGNWMKVQEILQRNAEFYADLNLKNGCLKSMTTNQFYSIMNHFARLVCGKDLDAFIENGDPLQAILNFMKQLDYPYTINKSMLKTPNAPHTFDHVVMMLMWLGEATNVSYYAADDEVIEKYLHNRDERLPDEEYTVMFSKAAQEGYLLWNNESDDHSTFIDSLSDGLVSAKLNHKVTTIAELNQLTEQLETKSKALTDNPVQLHNVHQFEQLESKYTEYETKEHELMTQLKEKHDRLAATTVNWNDKRTKVERTLDHMNELVHQVRNQRYNIDEYKQMSRELSTLNAAANTVRAEIKLIRDEESNQQIICARLLKKLSAAITAINERGIQIVKIINATRLHVGELDLGKLHLPPTPSVEHVRALAKSLSHILSTVKIQTHKLQIEFDRVHARLNVLKMESEMLAKEYQSMEKKYKAALFERSVAEKKSMLTKKKQENCHNKFTKHVDDATAKLEELKRDIAAEKVKIQEIEKKNIEMINEGEAQAMQIIRQKKELIQQIDALETEFDELLPGFDYPE